MNQRTISILIISTVILLYGGLFLAQYLIFFAHHPNFPELLRNVEKYSLDGNWRKAETTVNRVHVVWNRGNPVIAIKYNETDYSVLNAVLMRLKAAITTHDLSGAVRETRVAEFLFRNITSISPSP